MISFNALQKVYRKILLACRELDQLPSKSEDDDIGC